MQILYTEQGQDSNLDCQSPKHVAGFPVKQLVRRRTFFSPLIGYSERLKVKNVVPHTKASVFRNTYGGCLAAMVNGISMKYFCIAKYFLAYSIFFILNGVCCLNGIENVTLYTNTAIIDMISANGTVDPLLRPKLSVISINKFICDKVLPRECPAHRWTYPKNRVEEKRSRSCRAASRERARCHPMTRSSLPFPLRVIRAYMTASPLKLGEFRAG